MAAAKGGNFMVPELRREREASKLDLPELTTFIDGGEWVSDKRRAMCKLTESLQVGVAVMSIMYADKLVCEDPVFNLDDKYFLNREEAFEKATEKSVHYLKKSKELNLDELEKNLLKR